MRYISWAAFYEGSSDALYLDVLVPRVIRELVAWGGAQMIIEVPDTPAPIFRGSMRAINDIARTACDARDAFDIIFIHADTGGRGLARGVTNRSDAYCSAMKALCDLPPERCIALTPSHETEAWLLADGKAVTSALGFTGDPGEVGLPESAQEAERLQDPKHVLRSAIEAVAGRRRHQKIDNLFPAIAQRQSLERLRGSASFGAFEERVRTCLRGMGVVIG